MSHLVHRRWLVRKCRLIFVLHLILGRLLCQISEFRNIIVNLHHLVRLVSRIIQFGTHPVLSLFLTLMVIWLSRKSLCYSYMFEGEGICSESMIFSSCLMMARCRHYWGRDRDSSNCARCYVIRFYQFCIVLTLRFAVNTKELLFSGQLGLT